MKLTSPVRLARSVAETAVSLGDVIGAGAVIVSFDLFSNALRRTVPDVLLSGETKRLAAAGMALLLSAGVYALATSGLKAFTGRINSPTTSGAEVPAEPDTAPVRPASMAEARSRLREAAAADAAVQAAWQAQCSLDRGRKLLTSADAWQGHPGGDATFPIAPGFELHFRITEETGDAEFQLLSDNSQLLPEPITSLAQVEQLLADQDDAPASDDHVDEPASAAV